MDPKEQTYVFECNIKLHIIIHSVIVSPFCHLRVEESADSAPVMLQLHFGLDVAASSTCATTAIGHGIPVQYMAT